MTVLLFGVELTKGAKGRGIKKVEASKNKENKKHGSMEAWKHGSMEAWKHGSRVN